MSAVFVLPDLEAPGFSGGYQSRGAFAAELRSASPSDFTRRTALHSASLRKTLSISEEEMPGLIVPTRRQRELDDEGQNEDVEDGAATPSSFVSNGSKRTRLNDDADSEVGVTPVLSGISVY